MEGVRIGSGAEEEAGDGEEQFGWRLARRRPARNSSKRHRRRRPGRASRRRRIARPLPAGRSSVVVSGAYRRIQPGHAPLRAVGVRRHHQLSIAPRPAPLARGRLLEFHQRAGRLSATLRDADDPEVVTQLCQSVERRDEGFERNLAYATGCPASLNQRVDSATAPWVARSRTQHCSTLRSFHALAGEPGRSWPSTHAGGTTYGGEAAGRWVGPPVATSGWLIGR